MNFLECKKNSKKSTEGMPGIRLAILGNCATQLLATAIKGVAYSDGFAAEVLDTDYDQILAQIMDPDSELYGFYADAVLIVPCVERLYDAFCDTPANERAEFAHTQIAQTREYCKTLVSRGIRHILLCNYAEADDRIFGNYANCVRSSFIFQLRYLNILLMETAQENKAVHIVDVSYVQNRMGRDRFYDPKLYYVAKMPFSMEALPEVAKEISHILLAIQSRMKKCVVVDLDNTLWGGVVGDDGTEGIEIGELGRGRAYASLQKWLKELTGRGILLAVCSKNDEDKAKDPFLHHPEMVLRMEDFAMFVANWEDKAGNIQKIRDTLNLGMDSFVFLDDNPFERNLVKSMIPEISVPELPEDPAEYVSFLQETGLFETISFNEEDRKRTEQYRAEAQRVSTISKYADYDDYLKDLEMEAVAEAFDEFHVPRIAQLSQRSNQFNLRTVRFTEEDVRKRMEDPEYITRYFTLRDRFGDHGLISIVTMKREEDAYFVENWLMSCRVLKRGMEAFIVNEMIDAVKEAGGKELKAEYIPTPKNAMVAKIYETMGFKENGENRYRIAVDEFKKQKTRIRKRES